MKAVAYKHGENPNPKTGAGYGIRISKSDRDKHFDKTSPDITIHLSDGPTVTYTLAPSFWVGCTEIRDKEIGKWIWDSIGRAGGEWVSGRPPKFTLEPLSKVEFRLST